MTARTFGTDASVCVPAITADQLREVDRVALSSDFPPFSTQPR